MQSNQAELTQQNKQQYLISGIVDFSTVPSLTQKFSGFISASKSTSDGPVIVDLSQVKETNSAALAMMLEIVKSAQQSNVELYFKHLPATILTIAKAYGVENEIREICR